MIQGRVLGLQLVRGLQRSFWVVDFTSDIHSLNFRVWLRLILHLAVILYESWRVSVVCYQHFLILPSISYFIGLKVTFFMAKVYSDRGKVKSKNSFKWKFLTHQKHDISSLFRGDFYFVIRYPVRLFFCICGHYAVHVPARRKCVRSSNFTGRQFCYLWKLYNYVIITLILFLLIARNIYKSLQRVAFVTYLMFYVKLPLSTTMS